MRDDEGNRMTNLTDVGQLYIQSPMVFSGYVDGPRISEQDEIATGDYARLTHTGDLILEGRVNNKCIVGGMNVYPEEVERVIMQNIPVKHVMVAATPHYELGEVLIAYYESDTPLPITDVKRPESTWNVIKCLCAGLRCPKCNGLPAVKLHAKR